MAVHPDSAKVKIPPPFGVLLSIAVSATLSVIAPAPFLGMPCNFVVGLALCAAGVFLMLNCIRLFRKNRTDVKPWKPTSTIVLSGPYRYSRNPIYLAFLIFSLGVICLFDNAWALLYLPAFFLFLHYYVVLKEERYLKGKFGSDYEHLLRSTRRWI